MKTVLFLHGFFASGSCVPAKALKDVLGDEFRVLTPDLPMNPKRALEYIRQVCNERIIKYIQKTDIVLTEHIGCSNLNLMEQGKKDEDIYNQDTSWLRESDVLIGECTCPSLGVGYELAYAEAHNKPCHIFYDKTKAQLSAMLTGNPYFNIHPYEREEDIYSIIDTILK